MAQQLSQINTKINSNISNNAYNAGTKTYPEIQEIQTGSTFTVYYMQLVTENNIYLIIINCKMDTFLKKNLHRPGHIYILVKQNRSLTIIQNIKLHETLNRHMQVRTGSDTNVPFLQCCSPTPEDA